MQSYNRGGDMEGCRPTTEEGIGKDAGPQQRRGSGRMQSHNRGGDREGCRHTTEERIGKDAGTQPRRG